VKTFSNLFPRSLSRTTEATNNIALTGNHLVPSPACLRSEDFKPHSFEPSQGKFQVQDGSFLFYRAWIPHPRCSKALLLFHRGHEHSGRWQEFVSSLALQNVAVFAWDARGHGHSDGERGFAENTASLVSDMDEFVRHIHENHNIEVHNMIVLAHSVAAVVATAWVHDFAPPIRSLILATPAFEVKLYVPFAVPFLRLKQKFFPAGYVKSYVKSKMLTHDPDQRAAYSSDPLIFRQIAVPLLLDLFDTSRRLLADARAISIPTLHFVAESDWIVRNSTQYKFFNGLSSPSKQLEFLPGFHHAIFHEKNRQRVEKKVREFVESSFSVSNPAPTHPPQFIPKDDLRLSEPLSNLLFSIIRTGMKSIGRLSRGIQIGWQHGFDSGIMLDYVYANKPTGITPLGRFIDRIFLNSIGWRGIRQRNTHLQSMLRSAIESLPPPPLRILDIASGPGRYLMETVRSLPDRECALFLRDYKKENIEAASKLAKQVGLQNVSATLGDAFDRESLASLLPKVDIGIVSGLYELFPENEPVIASLQGLAAAIKPGGYLVYTNQPWHPQLEFIARVLMPREGKPWVMRCRPQAEMDHLVEQSGFKKLRQTIDPWGIFTVSLAQRL
jgi:alpha-beta hydrolase superfamily lysophospholipase/SAM-dependent methyltransferase